jgi:hypothetical protein
MNSKLIGHLLEFINFEDMTFNDRNGDLLVVHTLKAGRGGGHLPFHIQLFK